MKWLTCRKHDTQKVVIGCWRRWRSSDKVCSNWTDDRLSRHKPRMSQDGDTGETVFEHVMFCIVDMWLMISIAHFPVSVQRKKKLREHWLKTVRRHHSKDRNNLYSPTVAAFFGFLVLTVLMYWDIEADSVTKTLINRKQRLTSWFRT